MATESRRIMLTYEDLLEMPDDRNRYEVIDGNLEVTPAPTPDHQTAVLNLATVLNVHVKAHRLGTVFVAPCDVFFSEHNVVEPDIFFIESARRVIIERQLIRGAPTLVVEVLSPGTERRDRMIKQKLYAEFGVPHYWLMDPVSRMVEVRELQDGAYELTQVLDSRGTLRPSIFPDLQIELADIWD